MFGFATRISGVRCDRSTKSATTTANKHTLKAHEILSLKVPNIEFDFDVSDCMMEVVTDTSKVGS